MAKEGSAVTMESASRLLRRLFGPRPRHAAGQGGLPATAAPEPGAVFAHRTGTGATELARILDSASDELGIRHVRFELFYQYRFKTMEAGERTLALPTFRKRFTRTVDLGEETGS